MKELTLGYALAYRHEELALAVERIASGKFDVGRIVTAVVPLDETAWAFDALRRAEHVKVLIDPQA
jgi:threonine dehydrogenase-like Zn-dependent dehydrogenase